MILCKTFSGIKEYKDISKNKHYLQLNIKFMIW